MEQKHLVGKELFIIQQLYDEWLVIVRQPDTSPFVGDDETLYEIRVVVRPNEIPDTRMTIFNHYEHSVIFADPYYRNVAEALVAGGNHIKHIDIDSHGNPVITLRCDKKTAADLAFDADTLEYLNQENTALEIIMWPTRRHAEFVAGRVGDLQNYPYEDLDYDALIKDLMELRLRKP